MEITKELKEKLLKADSAEDIKALLGDQASEEEVTKAWEEIKRFKAAPEAVTDEELEAVNGGLCVFNGEYASNGKEVGCLIWNYIDWNEANDEICPKSKDGHEWGEATTRFIKGTIYVAQKTCKLCGYKCTYQLNKDGGALF